MHPAAQKIEDIAHYCLALSVEIEKGNTAIVPCALSAILKLLTDEVVKWNREYAKPQRRHV